MSDEFKTWLLLSTHYSSLITFPPYCVRVIFGRVDVNKKV